MTTNEIVDYLRLLADATVSVANHEATGSGSRVRLTMQASVLLEACDRMLQQQQDAEQLRDRLVRQACYFEQFEAASQPKTWPLFEEGDDEDPSLAL
jgi:hypothetical protein